jgi:hypothetical protein
MAAARTGVESDFCVLATVWGGEGRGDDPECNQKQQNTTARTDQKGPVVELKKDACLYRETAQVGRQEQFLVCAKSVLSCLLELARRNESVDEVWGG